MSGCFIPYYNLFYVIYRYVFSYWRVEINPYDITMAIHFDITMGNDVAMMLIVKSQLVMMLIGTSIVMSQ